MLWPGCLCLHAYEERLDSLAGSHFTVPPELPLLVGFAGYMKVQCGLCMGLSFLCGCVFVCVGQCLPTGVCCVSCAHSAGWLVVCWLVGAFRQPLCVCSVAGGNSCNSRGFGAATASYSDRVVLAGRACTAVIFAGHLAC